VGGRLWPAVVETVTGSVGGGLPLASSAVAVSVVEPPLYGTVAGFALNCTRAVATVPTEIRATPSGVTDPSLQLAAMTAVPDVLPATNVTVAFPCAVGACAGCTDPSVVTNVTMVPSGGMRSPGWTTCATMVAGPLDCRSVG